MPKMPRPATCLAVLFSALFAALLVGFINMFMSSLSEDTTAPSESYNADVHQSRISTRNNNDNNADSVKRDIAALHRRNNSIDSMRKGYRGRRNRLSGKAGGTAPGGRPVQYVLETSFILRVTSVMNSVSRTTKWCHEPIVR